MGWTSKSSTPPQNRSPDEFRGENMIFRKPKQSSTTSQQPWSTIGARQMPILRFCALRRRQPETSQTEPHSAFTISTRSARREGWVITHVPYMSTAEFFIRSARIVFISPELVPLGSGSSFHIFSYFEVFCGLQRVSSTRKGTSSNPKRTTFDA